MKKWVSLLVVTGILVSCMTACTQMSYKKALSLIEAGEYTQAYEILRTLDDEQAKATKERFRFVPVKCEMLDAGEDSKHTMTVTYNENNLPKSIVRTNAAGESEIYAYTYDEQGRILQEAFNHQSNKQMTTDYSYDRNGNISKVIMDFYSGTQLAKLYTYDDNNRLIKETQVDSAGVDSETEYMYDGNGNQTQIVYKNPSGGEEVLNLIYDSQGKLLRKQFASMNEEYRYTYDKNGNLIWSLYTDSMGSTTTQNYTYDANGKLLREENIYGEGHSRVYEYTYDVNGYLVKEVYISSGLDRDYTTTTVYTNDDYGNPIKMECSTGDQEPQVTYKEYRLVYLPFDYPETVESQLQRNYTW